MVGVCDKVREIAWEKNPLVDLATWYGGIFPLLSMSPLRALNEERARMNENHLTRLEFYHTLLIIPFEPLIEKTKDLLGQYVK